MKILGVIFIFFLYGCGAVKYNEMKNCNYYDSDGNKVKIKGKYSLEKYPGYKYKCEGDIKFEDRSLLYQGGFYLYDFTMGVLTIAAYTFWIWIWFV